MTNRRDYSGEFKEKVYRLIKKHEGKLWVSEIARQLDKHPASINIPIEQLVREKRVFKEDNGLIGPHLRKYLRTREYRPISRGITVVRF